MTRPVDNVYDMVDRLQEEKAELVAALEALFSPIWKPYDPRKDGHTPSPRGDDILLWTTTAAREQARVALAKAKGE